METLEPTLIGRTYESLVNWAAELRQALRDANADKAALRNWTNNFETP